MSDNKLILEVEKEKMRLELLFEFGLDMQSRRIRITGEIQDGYFDLIDSCLSELERVSKKTITVVISSPGGCPYMALAIVGRIKRSTCKIITEGYGQIMSAAVLILACGDVRRVSKYSWFMHHKSSYRVEGSHDDIKETVAEMDRQERTWSKWMADLSKKDEKYWINCCKKKDFYLDSEQCLEHGIIDEVI